MAKAVQRMKKLKYLDFNINERSKRLSFKEDDFEDLGNALKKCE